MAVNIHAALSLFQITNRTGPVLHVFFQFFFEHVIYDQGDIDITHMLERLRSYHPLSCQGHPDLCYDRMSDPLLLHMLQHMTMHAPTCLVLERMTEYHSQEGRYPNDDELLSYMNNVNEYEVNTLDYSDDRKTRNTIALETARHEGEETGCATCQGTIKAGDAIYVLPCKHIFHASEADCLGTTVLDWLTCKSTCPLCRQAIVASPENHCSN